MGKYKRIKRARISGRKLNLIVRCFLSDITSVSCSKIVCVNRKTTDRFYNYFRLLILEDQELEREQFLSKEETEIDESYFGPTRVRGKRGRGASKKIAVVGLLERHGRIFTKPIARCTREQLMPVILQRVKRGTDVFTDGWSSYDALAVYGFNHKKVLHSKDEFSAGDGNHINGVESFWSFAKRRLAKFNGIRKKYFSSHLKETEWRFNHRGKMTKGLRKLARDDRKNKYR